MDADTPDPQGGGPPVDPLNLRAMLMLDVAHEMVLQPDWPYRAVTVVMESHAGPGERFALYGANSTHAVDDVVAGRLTVSHLNPVAALNMARLGRGAHSAPQDVATIVVLPHHDQLAFAVRGDLGFTSLTDIAEARYPLRVSVRGSLDAVTPVSVDVVLRTHGFSLADVEAWGGTVSHDQPMPPHPSRLGRLAAGEIDAIFEEGAPVWVDAAARAGATLLPLDDAHLRSLEEQGFRRAVLATSVFPALAADVPTVDYSGWPVFCRTDAPDELVERFCRALESGRDRMVWGIGPVHQDPLPLEQMVTESPSTPFDVPLHPAADRFWRSRGYLR